MYVTNFSDKENVYTLTCAFYRCNHHLYFSSIFNILLLVSMDVYWRWRFFVVHKCFVCGQVSICLILSNGGKYRFTYSYTEIWNIFLCTVVASYRPYCVHLLCNAVFPLQAQTVKEVFARQLMQISGVSGEKAAAILERYNTPAR